MKELVVHPAIYRVLDSVIDVFSKESKLRKKGELELLKGLLKLLCINKAGEQVTIKFNRDMFKLLPLLPSKFYVEIDGGKVLLMLKEKTKIERKNLYAVIDTSLLGSVKSLYEFLFILFLPYRATYNFQNFLKKLFPMAYKHLRTYSPAYLQTYYYRFRKKYLPDEVKTKKQSNQKAKPTPKDTITIHINQDFNINFSQLKHYLPKEVFLSRKDFYIISNAYTQNLKFLLKYKHVLPNGPVLVRLMLLVIVSVILRDKYRVYWDFENGLLGFGLVELLNEADGLYITSSEPGKFIVRMDKSGYGRGFAVKLGLRELTELITQARFFRLFLLPIFGREAFTYQYSSDERQRYFLSMYLSDVYGNDKLLHILEKVDPEIKQIKGEGEVHELQEAQNC